MRNANFVLFVTREKCLSYTRSRQETFFYFLEESKKELRVRVSFKFTNSSFTARCRSVFITMELSEWFQKMKSLFRFSTVIFVVFISCNLANGSNSESFSEELLIKPLPTGHVYSHFQFTTKWDVNPEETNRESAF